MPANSFQYLFEQYINGRIDPEGLKQLKKYIDDTAHDAEFNGLLTNAYNNTGLQLITSGETEIWNLIKERIEAGRRPVHRVHFLRTAWFRYAAAIIILTSGIAIYYMVNNNQERTASPNNLTVKTDIQPASNKAILTLSDGKKIELDNAASETINDGALSIKNEAGQLIYGSQLIPSSGGVDGPVGANQSGSMRPGRGGSTAVAYNTMSTPNGGQYQLTLSDGTRAWLNAASSITYPTKFIGTTREVKITGEVYFEVSQNKNQPFIVRLLSPAGGSGRANNDPQQNGNRRETEGGYSITVLGTSFNVSNYADEPISKTSLISGSIKINNIILKPGQAFTNGKIITTDISQDIAWKNGLFNFQDKKFDEVMRQIARWYDIEIIYPNGIPNKEYGGKLKRNLTLSQMLKILENSAISFRLEGRKLIVKP